MTRRIFHMSDFLQRLLRYSTPEVGFDEMKSLIPEAYAEIFGPENCLLQNAHTPKRAIPLIASDGRRLWLQWKVLGRETTPDGRDVMTGYVQQIEFEPPSENGRDRVRIDNLLYRLNSISHTLLALLHSGRTRDTVNKILYEVLTMFRGDRAYIIEFDWEQRTHNCTYEVTAAGVSCEQERLSSLSMEDFPWWTERVTKGPFHHSFRHPRSASRGGGRTRPADGAEDQIAAYHATGLAGQGLGLCRHRHR